jgi:murein DD-endopeptidase MepM/ murein hydrolase activator NlpD
MKRTLYSLVALTCLAVVPSCASPTAESEDDSTESAVATDESALSTGFGLPFPAGRSYVITQGPFNGYSHGPPYNTHAIDFGMPIGATVVASGAGRIVYDGWFQNEIRVIIDHGNNRCTQYVHLNRSIHYVGQYVRRGEVLGESGATGNVSGPHLHWNMINCNNWTSREVVPTDELGRNYRVGTVARSTNSLR